MNFCYFTYLIILVNNSIFYKLDESNFESYRKKFIENYQSSQAEKDIGMKAFTFDISNNGFIRYRRTAANDRMEYFSVRVDKVLYLNYLGNETAGWLILKCEKESVIYQTYRDIKGDVDMMVDELKLPVKAVELSKINQWDSNFINMKQAFLNTQK